MKALLFFIYFTSMAAACPQKDAGLIVHVRDASSGLRVRNAKVTLEGFGKVEIVGKYHKKEKHYYFDSIPVGYNTVMVHHAQYNEKGFQDTRGLPHTLSFQLNDRNDVRYQFLHADSPEGNSAIFSFIEDPFKIVVRPNKPMHYNDFKDMMLEKIAELQLNIIFVNPYYEDTKNDMPHINNGHAYPYIGEANNDDYVKDPLLPVFGGFSTLLRDVHPNNICIIFKNCDGSVFKRFNDPVIKSLTDQGLNVYSVLLIKNNPDDNINKKSRNPFKIRDRNNREYNREHEVDSSMCFFYKNYLPNSPRVSRSFHNKGDRYDLDELEDRSSAYTPDFIPIPNNRYQIPENDLRENDYEASKLQSIPSQEKSIGLGILDQYEYYSRQ